jgi:hypothetical protein
MRSRGKLSLVPGELYVVCHNDPNKKECDYCMGCSDPQCNMVYCDVHGNCQCERTDCLCLGRPTAGRPLGRS